MNRATCNSPLAMALTDTHPHTLQLSRQPFQLLFVAAHGTGRVQAASEGS